jgi:hypothetical protein
MKRFLTLALLFCFLMNGLFAQNNSENEIQSVIIVETGLSFSVQPSSNFSMPLNVEFQRVKKKWGFGAALGLDFDKYSEGDCNRRLEVGTYVQFRDPGNVHDLGVYCYNSNYLNLKPSVFGSYYFLQKKKLNLFAKIGLTGNILNIFHSKGTFYEFDTTTDTFGLETHKVINSGPIQLKRNGHSWTFDNINLLSGLGLNYSLNKRTSLRFTLQSEVKMLFLSKYDDKKFLFLGLCGLSFKI